MPPTNGPMPRFLGRSIRMVFDLGVVSLAYWLAWLFRFEFQIPGVALQVATLTWPCVIGLQYCVLLAFGVERIAWRYINMRDAMRILAATVISSTALVG